MAPSTALSGALVGLAAIGTAHVALKPPFRRDLAALPTLRTTLGVAIPVCLAGAVAIFLQFPALLHLAASCCAVALAFLWWRARPTYGRSRGWPAGSLGIGASLDAIDNKAFYQEQAALHGPVFKMSQFGRPVLCVVGLSRGRKILLEHGDSLAGASLPYNRFVGRGLLRYMPREDHQEEGPLFRRAFSEAALAKREADVREACRRQLDFVATRSATSPDGVNLRPHISAWTVEALSSAFFGINPGDPRFDVLDRAQRAMNLDRRAGTAWERTMESSMVSATAALREVGSIHRTRGETASVLGALIGASPDSLDDEGRLRNLFMIFRLGIGDLSAALTWVAYHLSIHTKWQDKVRNAGRTDAAPKGMLPSDLATRVVLETLRLEQSEFLYRRIVRPIQFEGFQIPAGWLLRVCVQESHQDPQVFPSPAMFDPDRFVGRTLSKAEYATFGLDGHGCMGASIVHYLGRILVEELCIGFRMRTVRDGPPEHGTRHRHHWRPSMQWTVAMERQA